MEKIFSYNAYQALNAVNENIDELIDQVDAENATQIRDLVSSQDKILKNYDLSPSEIDNIKDKAEDSIRMKLGTGLE